MENKIYIDKIKNANNLELIIITYNIMLDKINITKNLTNNLKIKENLFLIRSLLSNLICSLNFNIELSKDILAIYMYINKLIIKAEIFNNINSIYKIKKILEECENILHILLLGWSNINKDKTLSEQVSNNQMLFAGLTYKNGKLEEFVYDNVDRGFKI